MSDLDRWLLFAWTVGVAWSSYRLGRSHERRLGR